MFDFEAKKENLLTAVLCQVALGLKHTQDSAKLIHADVKPANILLRIDAHEAVLTDFGICRSAGATCDLGVQFCTPPYRPPELWVSTGPTTLSSSMDVFSLGATVADLGLGSRTIPQSCLMSLKAAIVGTKGRKITDPLWLRTVCLPLGSESFGS